MSGGLPIPFNTLRSAPELSDLLAIFKRDIFLTFNCHALATVQTVDTDKNTLTALMNWSRTVADDNGEQSQIPYQPMVDVPYFIFGAGEAFLNITPKEGDQALICFNDRDLDNWISGATSGAVNSPRLHSFADPIALVGMNRYSGVDAVRLMLTDGNVKLGINPSNHKVTFENNSTSLIDALQSIINHLKSLVSATAAITVLPGTFVAPPGGGAVVGISGTPVNASSITAISTDLSNDLSTLQELLE
jgi:hypothetical protein